MAGGRRWLAVAGVAGGIYRRPKLDLLEQDNHKIEGDSKVMTLNKIKIEENIDMKIQTITGIS